MSSLLFPNGWRHVLGQHWTPLLSGQAPWLHQKEAIEALDCGPPRGWGTLRGAPAGTSCRVLQSRRESDGDTARYRSKLAVSSLQKQASAPSSPFPLLQRAILASRNLLQICYMIFLVVGRYLDYLEASPWH